MELPTLILCQILQAHKTLNSNDNSTVLFFNQEESCSLNLVIYSLYSLMLYFELVE